MIQRGKNDYRAHCTLICNFFFSGHEKEHKRDDIYFILQEELYIFSTCRAL